MKKSYEIDMCNGPLLGKILIFALPLMLSGMLQLLFNAADIVVVGRFAGPTALAAVGSTGALINLLVNVFMGLSIGTNVLTAQRFGAQDEEGMSDTVHTSILVSIVSGFFLVIVGIALAKPLLTLMGTPDEVIDQSALYMRIYFAGMPAMMLYNFGAAILRAVGDTKRPLYFLMAAGVINVVFNLFFVIVFHMGVAGVALATVISQVISAILVTRCLIMTDGIYRLDVRKLRIKKEILIKIARVGLPAGFQGAVFSLSNVLIQSSVNSFGSIAMAGNTAGSNIENFVYMAMNAMYQTALSFTSQNMGAQKTQRVKKVLFICLGAVIVIGLVLGNGAVFFGHQLLGIYSSDAEVIAYGINRMKVLATWYFLCGMMDVMVGSLRGMGYSLMPMIVSLLGACGLRVLWIFTIFQWKNTLFSLYLSYPVTWTITFLAHFICWYFIAKKKLGKKGANA